MSNESETPRTDAVEFGDCYVGDHVVPADFARQLERELAEATNAARLQAELIEKLTGELEEAKAHTQERDSEDETPTIGLWTGEDGDLVTLVTPRDDSLCDAPKALAKLYLDFCCYKLGINWETVQLQEAYLEYGPFPDDLDFGDCDSGWMLSESPTKHLVWKIEVLDARERKDSPWYLKNENSDLRAQIAELQKDRERLYSALLKLTGSFGLVQNGTDPNAPGHKRNLDAAKSAIEASNAIDAARKEAANGK